jgi:hypothetical protein
LFVITFVLNKTPKHRQEKKKGARCWWLMPVILGTEEPETRRIVVQSQLGK